jgi:hypothetical protein
VPEREVGTLAQGPRRNFILQPPLATDTLILHHPLPSPVVVHPNLPHELHHIPFLNFRNNRLNVTCSRPSSTLINDLATSRTWNSLFMLFAATSLLHLQQQFLSLFIVLHVAICTRAKNKKGAPVSRSALLFNVARDFRVSCVPTLVLGRPEAFSTSLPRPSSNDTQLRRSDTI